jgi:hypothetical protein
MDVLVVEGLLEIMVELIDEGFLEKGDFCGVSGLFWTGLTSLIL